MAPCHPVLFEPEILEVGPGDFGDDSFGSFKLFFVVQDVGNVDRREGAQALGWRLFWKLMPGDRIDHGCWQPPDSEKICANFPVADPEEFTFDLEEGKVFGAS